MAPLTPAGLMSDARQVSPLHVPNLPTIPSPTIHRRPKAESGCFLGRTAAAASQGSAAPTQAGFRSASVGLHLSKGRLATTTDRIEFVILRTGHSPPGALHLPSLGRSSFRLRDADSIPTRTSTSLVQCTCGRTLANRRSLSRAGPPARQRIDIRPGGPGSCQPTEVGQGQGGTMPSLPVKHSGETVRGDPEPVRNRQSMTG
jgi:hypothetical protein